MRIALFFLKLRKKTICADKFVCAYILFGQASVGHLESECCRIGFKKSIFVAILILRRLGILGATLIFAR